MKKIKYYSALTLFVIASACSNNTPSGPPPPTEPTVEQDHARVDTTQIGNPEVEQYRTRINNRIREINNNIAERRALRNAEKDVKKQKEYDIDIESREKRKGEFQQKLDNFEARTKEGWENFKAELDDLFNRDDDRKEKEGKQEKK